jgi:hypothetical protein
MRKSEEIDDSFFNLPQTTMSDAPSTPTQPATTASSPNRSSRAWLVLAGLAGLIAAMYVSTRVLGWVSGEEFSPDSFQRRRFEYYEIPLIQLQITPVSREDTTNDLERYLVSKKLVQKTAAEPRWDLVWARQGTQTPHLGDAGILCAYLDALDTDGNSSWQTWSAKNPQLAKILWTAVDRLAEQRHYVLIPDVFSLAGQAREALVFEQAVAEKLADRYELLARTQLDLGDRQLARELAEEGLRQAPKRESLQRLLDDSHES